MAITQSKYGRTSVELGTHKWQVSPDRNDTSSEYDAVWLVSTVNRSVQSKYTFKKAMVVQNTKVSG